MTATGSCPICGRELGPKRPDMRPPFCSPRCRLIDLGKWLDGSYQPAWLLEPEEHEALAALEGMEPSEVHVEEDDFEPESDEDLF